MSDKPEGYLASKWTGETVPCPNCRKKALDKYSGGPDIKGGIVRHTDYIYHCRECDKNYTQEEYDEALK